MFHTFRLFLYSIWALTAIVLSYSPAIYAEATQTPLVEALERASQLCNQLQPLDTLEKKCCALSKNPSVMQALTSHQDIQSFLQTAPLKVTYVFQIAAALNQFDSLFAGLDTVKDKNETLSHLATTLLTVEDFYKPMGGLLGYHKTVLSLLMTKEPESSKDRFYPPPSSDVRQKTADVWKFCYQGVRNLPKSSQIFVLGGAGDRLKLIDEKSGEPLPAACLLFCGRSLFEGLMRDVEAQEYWHYRAFGDQVSMPVLIMTSLEKNNDHHIQELLSQSNWCGHNPASIRRIIQPLVPVIDMEGRWIVTAPAELALKPGGHGIIWKLAQDSGALQWLHSLHVENAVVRQINNPLAGLDGNIPTFAGFGMAQKKSFGFASPPSKPGLAEGMNVLGVTRRNDSAAAAITNIEYTQFSTLKNLLPDLFKEGICPANINLLYANLGAIEKELPNNPIPGTIVNPKTTIDLVLNGQSVKKTGARLESSMQNIADALASPIDPSKLPLISASDLQTYICLFDRAKIMSVAKKAYQEGQSSSETPEGCLFDWHTANRKLLATHCRFSLPLEQSVDEFLQRGPNFVYTQHPALGPLWEVIGQKLTKGSIAENSELELEIAELACSNLTLDGSLRIIAEHVTGKSSPEGRLFTNEVGRARLTNVSVQNRGLGSNKPAAVLKGTIERIESCEIILQGFSEVVANNITIAGPFKLIVPDGHRATLTQAPGGKVNVALDSIKKPSWQYTIRWQPDSAPQLS